MIFSIVLILLIAGVAYWHFLQGFWSATLSAILAVLAAITAFSFTEPVVNLFKPGKFADSANGMVLCGLFIVIYISLRFLFDAVIPGNLRFQSTIDGIGGAVMGIVAGIFATGVIAIAAQAMPFGPSIAGYSRYVLNDKRDVIVQPAIGSDVNATIANEMKSDSFSDEKPSGLLVPVDDMLLSAVSLLSSGSLAGDRPIAVIHPDYLTELFGQRIGLETGAKHSAPNFPGDSAVVSVTEMHTLNSVPQKDAEPQLDAKARGVRKRDLPPVFKPENGQVLLVVRTMFDTNAGDVDGIFRFSPANCRLVFDDAPRGGNVHHFKDYFPVGTLESGIRLYNNRIDDPLFVDVKSGGGADLVYVVDLNSGILENTGKSKIAPGVFMEIKHLGYIDLEGQDVIVMGITASDKVAVMRPLAVQPLPLVAKIDPNSLSGAPLQNITVAVSNRLPTPPLTLPATDGDITGVPGVEASVVGGKLTKMNVSGAAVIPSLSVLQAHEFAVPLKKELVIVMGTPSPTDPWAWAGSDLELVDVDGNSYRVIGGYCLLKQGDQFKMVARFSSDGSPQSVGREDGDVKAAALLYLVPIGTKFAEFQWSQKPIFDLRNVTPKTDAK